MYGIVLSKVVQNRKIVLGSIIAFVVSSTLIGTVFAADFKKTYNYNLDDVAFQICKDEYDIYENAASTLMGDPQKLMEWKQYTQCHDDAILVLYETQHLCSNEIKQLENTKAVATTLDSYDRLHYDYNLVSIAEKVIDCHVRVYYEKMETPEIVQTTVPTTVQTPKPNGGGCLIATATYGTEMAPQVQFLREIRDNTVMSTSAGIVFISGFNQIYYSFSPTIADMERENPMLQKVVRILITPMVSTLSLMTLAEEGSEIEVLGLGISVIILNLGMYIVTPTVTILKITKKIKMDIR